MPYLYNVKSIAKPDFYEKLEQGSGLPITVEEAKKQLNIPAGVSIWDTQIESYIRSCLAYFENHYTTLIETTYLAYFNTFTRTSLLERAHLRSIEEVSYFDTDNVEQIVASSNYYTTLADYFSYLIFVDDFNIPQTYNRPQIFKVKFKAGIATDHTDTPEDIKQGFKMYVAYMYANKGDCSETEIPSGIKSMFFPYKIIQIVKNDVL
jgi:uncharacterized phiE125 gp8 family phage protein